MIGLRRPDDEAIAIDPLGHLTRRYSAIPGLGDDVDTAGLDEKLAFHTAYAAYEAGRLRFTLRFDGLTAENGVLTVKLLAVEPGATTSSATASKKVRLPQLARSDGSVTLDARVASGTLYALVGILADGSDCRADRLTVSSSRESDSSFHDRLLEEARTGIVTPADGRRVVNAVATLATPRSQMCTAAQFDEPDYRRWLDLMARPMHRHRKQWEYVYICRLLEHMGALRPLGRGLGFGCGIEPLPAVFAAHNIFVTATDLPLDDPRTQSWRGTDQLLSGLVELRDPAIVPDHVFDARVEYAGVDMTAIPIDRRNYDFCWSSCSLEHLGSLDAGMSFFEASLATLKPGGVAVHTTELNVTSDEETIATGETVLYRRRDMLALADRLAGAGHEVVPLTFDQGDQLDDRHVDVPPYSSDNHLKLALGQFVSTSFGLAVRKAS